MEDSIIEALGYQGAFEALTAVLGLDALQDNYEYIMRMYDIPSIAQEENESFDWSTIELGNLLSQYFIDNPQASHSTNDIRKFFASLGYDLTLDEVNAAWNYYVDYLM